jgi:hypothetical protein
MRDDVYGRHLHDMRGRQENDIASVPISRVDMVAVKQIPFANWVVYSLISRK